MELKNINSEKLQNIFLKRKSNLLDLKRENSVFVLFYLENNSLNILYTKRALHLKHQPGDICFPGGGKEGDESDLETALRETEEELKISRKNIKIIGKSDFIITVYGAKITPFIGFLKDIKLKEINFNTDEVDSVFGVPIEFFNKEPEKHYLNFKPYTDDNFPFKLIQNGENYNFSRPRISEYFYNYKGNIIWGLTAKITKNVINIIQSY